MDLKLSCWPKMSRSHHVFLARQFTYLTTHSHRVVPVKEILSKMLFHTVLQSLKNISRFSAKCPLKGHTY